LAGCLQTRRSFVALVILLVGFSEIAVIRVYDEAGNVIGTHERKGDFKEW
jgi:hypothetical protein